MITDLSNLDWLQTKKSTILLCSFFINYNFLEVLLIEIHHITNFFCSLPLFLAFFHLFVNPKWFSSLRPHFHFMRFFLLFFKMLDDGNCHKMVVNGNLGGVLQSNLHESDAQKIINWTDKSQTKFNF